MDTRTVVLSLEGLAIAPLGPYGCSWNQTPTLDAIAASGAVFDRCIVPTDDSASILDTLWRSLPPTYRFSVVTDNRRAIEIAGAHDCAEVLFADTATTNVPAGEVVGTSLAELLASGMDVLQRSDAAGDRTSLVWLHSDFLVRRWDAPRGLLPFEQWTDESDDENGPQEEYQQEPSPADPADPYARTANFFDSVEPPQLRWGKDHNPDVTLAWMNTYAAQVLLLDVLLSVVMDAIADAPTRLILLGTSGFALGENKHFGNFGPLHSPRIQVPVIAVGPQIPIARCGQPCTPAAALASLIGGAVDDAPADDAANLLSPAAWSTEPDGFEPSVRTAGTDGSRGLTTPDWYYYHSADGEPFDTEPFDTEQLFVKPDDRSDINNVSSRVPDVLEQVRAKL